MSTGEANNHTTNPCATPAHRAGGFFTGETANDILSRYPDLFDELAHAEPTDTFAVMRRPAPTGRRAIQLWCVLLTLLAFAQSPGYVVADTKLDLTANPWGFFQRALTLWLDIFPLGQMQNQAYGYYFPQGLFFALWNSFHQGLHALFPAVADVIAAPWVGQRLWWALLLCLGFIGFVKVASQFRIGSPSARIIGGLLYTLSPRIITSIGAISSEAWVVALAPWVLLPVARMLDGASHRRPRWRTLWYRALSSAAAVFLLGAINAVATAAAILPSFLWLVYAGLFEGKQRRRAALRFLIPWAISIAAVTAWWVVPLLLLGKYSPPFIDYMESAYTTTYFNNLTDVLRGTDAWVAYATTERPGATALVQRPVLIVFTGAIAALGIAGLSMAGMPRRRPWLVMFCTGLLILASATAPFSPFADQIQAFLDDAGAPLRNVHKFDPLVRLPLLMGLTHLCGRLTFLGILTEKTNPLATLGQGAQPPAVPDGTPRERLRAARKVIQHPERYRRMAAAGLVVVLAIGATAPAWSLRLGTSNPYREIPQYWYNAAAWLNTHASNTRTMILPSAPAANQSWGLTRDEPAQPLLDVPWVVRDSVPIVPASAVRSLDGINSALLSGRGQVTLSQSLAGEGIGYLLFRLDLAPTANPTVDVRSFAAGTDGLNAFSSTQERFTQHGRNTLQALALTQSLTPEQAILRTIARSPGFDLAARFDDVVIFRVEAAQGTSEATQNSGSDAASSGDSNGSLADDAAKAHTATGADPGAQGSTSPLLVNADEVPTVSAAPEALPRLNEADAELTARRAGTLDKLAGLTDGIEASWTFTGANGEKMEHAQPDTADLPTTAPLRKLEARSGTTATDTPGLREHNFGRSLQADSDILNKADPQTLHHPTMDYQFPGGPNAEVIEQNGRVTASSSVSDGGARTGSVTGHSVTAAVDQQIETEWVPDADDKRGQWIQVTPTQAINSGVLRVTTVGQPTSLLVSTNNGSVIVQATPNSEVGAVLPQGSEQTAWVRVTVLDPVTVFGIADMSLRDVSDWWGDPSDANAGNDVTPRRWVWVESPAETQRWVFGQEINEGIATRLWQVPKEMDVEIDSAVCAAPSGSLPDTLTAQGEASGFSSTQTWGSRAQAELNGSMTVVRPSISLDGNMITTCGQRYHLTAGLHVVAFSDTWVSLTSPDYKPAAEQSITAIADGADIAAADTDRYLVLPETFNDGRVATVGDTPLEATTIDGWKQAWMVPAGTTGTLHITFAPQRTYQWGLWGGFATAILALISWAVVGYGRLRRHRRRQEVDAAKLSGPRGGAGGAGAGVEGAVQAGAGFEVASGSASSEVAVPGSDVAEAGASAEVQPAEASTAKVVTSSSELLDPANAFVDRPSSRFPQGVKATLLSITLGVVAAMVAGVPGLGVAFGVLAAHGVLMWRRGQIAAHRTAVVVAFLSVAAAGVWLSYYPWSSTHYAGFDWGPQLLCVTGIAAVFTSHVIPLSAANIARLKH